MWISILRFELKIGDLKMGNFTSCSDYYDVPLQFRKKFRDPTRKEGFREVVMVRKPVNMGFPGMSGLGKRDCTTCFEKHSVAFCPYPFYARETSTMVTRNIPEYFFLD